MSYVVLARKYRPRSFSQMVGQEHVVQALTNALKQQRLHHAYLFTGTRGIGKTTVSRILAKSLNCTGPDGTGGITDQPCGVCQACTEIDADRYIDYIELDAASNRGIDEVRELLERAAYKPSVGRFKVFMIDEAHQLTKESFNALLKTLEEPPEYLKFVLATTDPQKMLPTVLSRCLQFNLRPMPPEVVRGHLQHVLQAEAVQSDEGALRLLSRAARGSMRDALSLTDQAIAYGGGALSEGVVRTMLGTVDRSHANRIVQALAERDGAALLEAVNALRSMGLSAAGTLEEMATLLQQMAVVQAVPGALDEHDPDAAQVQALAATLPADETQLLYSIVLQGRAELTLASDEYAALTMVLLRLLAFPKAGAGQQPAATPQRAAATAQSAPLDMGRAARQAVAPPPRPVPARPAAEPARPTGMAPQAGPAVRAPAAAPQAPQAPQSPRSPQSPQSPQSPASTSLPQRAAAAPANVPAQPPRALPRPAPSGGLQEPPPWLDDGPPADDYGSAAVATLERPPVRHVAEEGRPFAANRPRSAMPPMDEPAAPADAIETAIADDVPALAAEPATPTWEVQRTELGDRWAGVVAQLNERGAVVALVRELAQQAELIGIDGDTWRLRVERETLRAQPLRDKLQAALAAVVSPAPQLEVETGVAQDSVARREAAERERRQREAERIIRNDPLVQELMNQFRTARFVPGSIKPV